MRKNYSKDMLVDHHLLEIILWKADGPTSKSGIRNRKLMENPIAYQERLRLRREKRAQKRRSMLINSSVIEEENSVCQ